MEESQRERLATTIPCSLTGPSSTLAISLWRSQCRPFTAAFTRSLSDATRTGALEATYVCPDSCVSSTSRIIASALHELKCCLSLGFIWYVFSRRTLGFEAAAAATATAAMSLSMEPLVMRRTDMSEEATPLKVDLLRFGWSVPGDLGSSDLECALPKPSGTWEFLRSASVEFFWPGDGSWRYLPAVVGLLIPLCGGQRTQQ